ncbi:MAG: aminoglycoside phosphotransferase family protein [Rhodococcus sp. (in: high G+C Gram-positive bacteria)]|uniref:phosphotransferase family protein n=1 Tax=Rhodococcus sp. TaxID=1831 RepID=UPI002ADB22DB|nr:aminoglycoside phosphotransferase family protein [Rhodococcus sp. (in: high G+C Gram-positive bacteria)]
MTDLPEPLTCAWVTRHLKADERILDSEALPGGTTADVRKLTTDTGRYLVLRSYVDAARLRYAEEWLDRESFALKLFQRSDVSAPRFVAVDSTAEHCEYPSLLMTHLPGSTVLTDQGVDARLPLLARQLVAIHNSSIADRPPEYQALTTADSVVVPSGANAQVWSAAIDVIRRPAPAYEGRLLHRDFQPGNVLFGVRNMSPTIAGVVDWAGTCWGPTDLDVAHCSTNLALLHGPQWGSRFANAYESAGGLLSDNAEAQRYWRIRDALACSEEVQLWAQPWRDAGRTDLTPGVIEDRLDAYLRILMNA